MSNKDKIIVMNELVSQRFIKWRETSYLSFYGYPESWFVTLIKQHKHPLLTPALTIYMSNSAHHSLQFLLIKDAYTFLKDCTTREEFQTKVKATLAVQAALDL